VTDRRSILLLCRTARREASNVAQHIDALKRLSRHDVSLFNPVDRPDACALLDVDEFDVVVIHYSIGVMFERYLPSVLRDKISRFTGLKAQFIQDEYRAIDLVTQRIGELGVELLFTCVPEHEVDKVYGRVPGLKTVTTFPGYVPDELVGRSTAPLAERPLDVGYRGRTVPYWLGRLGYEKVEIGTGFAERAAAYGLRVDISSSEEDRIYGEAWNRFLSSCRATLGTESGASIADLDGSVERAVNDYLSRHADATFEQVEKAVLAPYEGNVVINTISPRAFEAAALRTAMVFFPGEYSGAIEPWTHYLPLAKDFSNMDEIVERLRDLPALEAMTERAYQDLVASGRFSLARFVAEFDVHVAKASRSRAPGAGPAYTRATRRRLIPTASALRLRFVAGKVAQPALMTALAIRDPDVRRLATVAGRYRVSAAALAQDLWRLAALRRGVRAGLFSASASLEDASRRLVITTDSGPPPEGSADGLAEALASGTVEELIWNHSRVGTQVPLMGAALVPSRVGSDRIAGAHSFRALVELVRSAPEQTISALKPLLRTHT
jgi:hypothetical protein